MNEQLASDRSAQPPAQGGGLWGSPITWGIALLVIAISLFWMASEQHYRACVDRAQAQYPAVAVSSLISQQTGPLKVSFVRERARALDGCGHFF